MIRILTIFIILFNIDQFSFAKERKVATENLISEIRSFKPSLSKADVEIVQTKSGDQLASATVTDSQDETNSKTEFYVKEKGHKEWRYLDVLKLDSATFEFRPDGILKVAIEEGGSVSSEATTLWRFQNGKLGIIGQDSVLYNRPALFKNSKKSPFKTTTSTNFVTGKKTITSEFANEKETKSECKFNPIKFQKQKISELTSEGATEPNCQK